MGLITKLNPSKLQRSIHLLKQLILNIEMRHSDYISNGGQTLKC